MSIPVKMNGDERTSMNLCAKMDREPRKMRGERRDEMLAVLCAKGIEIQEAGVGSLISEADIWSETYNLELHEGKIAAPVCICSARHSLLHVRRTIIPNMKDAKEETRQDYTNRPAPHSFVMFSVGFLLCHLVVGDTPNIRDLLFHCQEGLIHRAGVYAESCSGVGGDMDERCGCGHMRWTVGPV
jgi:hypothetical protein